MSPPKNTLAIFAAKQNRTKQCHLVLIVFEECRGKRFQYSHNNNDDDGYGYGVDDGDDDVDKINEDEMHEHRALDGNPTSMTMTTSKRRKINFLALSVMSAWIAREH